MTKCPECGYDYPDGCDATCDYKHPMTEWIDVKEGLPTEDGMYEVCYEATQLSERCCGREWFIDGEWIPMPISCHLNIIYWMPLPKPPGSM